MNKKIITIIVETGRRATFFKERKNPADRD